MYSVLSKTDEQPSAFSLINKLIKFLKLSFHSRKSAHETYGVVNYITRSVKNNDVVIAIGSSHDDYLYLLRKRAGNSGKVIVFESQPGLHEQLTSLKKMLQWDNVTLETDVLAEVAVEKVIYKSAHKLAYHGAVVININDKPVVSTVYNIKAETIDNYCKRNNVIPSFLKIDGEGNELSILKGAFFILKNYKPALLLRCEQRISGEQSILETFAFLKKLGYKGYFVLDTIQIPIVNFDYNVYQNSYNNFYCCYFMFE